jgi:hypothetical protein
LSYQHRVEAHIRRGRFLGYAGIPMILTMPCFFMSAVAAHRLFRVHSGQRDLFKLTVSPSHLLSAEKAVNTASPPSHGVHPQSADDDFADDEGCDVVVTPRNHTPHADEMTGPAATLSVDDICPPRSHAFSSSLSSPSPTHLPDTCDRLRESGEPVSTTPIDNLNNTAIFPASGESFRPVLSHEVCVYLALEVVRGKALLDNPGTFQVWHLRYGGSSCSKCTHFTA